VSAEVLVVGLDAAEATLIESWGQAGLLPNLTALRQQGVRGALSNCLETLPGAIWPEITTGRSGGKVGRFYHPRQIHTGEAVARRLSADDVDARQYYWSAASDAGRRVAVVDLPQTVPTPGLNGVQVFEWGLHDRSFAIQSQPTELLEELSARHGDHPVKSCDRAHGGTEEGYRHLLHALLDGVSRKTALLLDVIGRGDWDLFACCYGELHCTGHQFWHFMDATHPLHEPDATDELQRALLSVYQRVDEGVGALIDAAGGRGPTVVVASHGMGPKVGGPQLLPEVLRRLGMGGPTDTRLWLSRVLPAGVKNIVRKPSKGDAAEKVLGAPGAPNGDLRSARKRAVVVRNNRCGGIRLNLVGREPYGSVQPGAEADALVDELRDELSALRDPASGASIVDRVDTAAEVFGPDHHPDLPDVIVVFRTDLGILSDCQSPRVGQVHQPPQSRALPRTGDHTPQSRIWAAGPGIEAGADLVGGDVLDVAPTVLRLLDVDPPDGLDGRTLDDVVGAGGVRRPGRGA
jgi:predicted AlkP superfamily phosphohydrolase/phosphomutase